MKQWTTGLFGSVFLGALILMLSGGCGSNERKEYQPRAIEPDRAQGEAILMKMSKRLASAQVLGFSTTEVSERAGKDGNRVKLKFTGQLVMRRPDRLWFRLSGDRDLEGFYYGRKMTIVSHKEKVFGEFPTPLTIDETVNFLSERYDIAIPIGDLLTADPHRTLVSSATTGGLMRREDVDGVACNLLTWRHPNVDWSIWIPAGGEPLPKKLQVTYKGRRGQPATTILFSDWNLAPQVTDATFARRAPRGYEGIPVIQRAEAVLKEQEESQSRDTKNREVTR